MSVTEKPTSFLGNQPEVLSSKASQRFSWPMSPDKVIDTALLVSCLNEGKKEQVDSTQFASYQSLAERVLCCFENSETNPSCTLSLVQEIIFVVQATAKPNHYQRVINKLKTHIEHDLNSAALQGWAALISQRAHLPEGTSLSSAKIDCKRLLTNAHLRLTQSHLEGNASQLSVLLQTILFLLEIMFDAKWGELDAGALKENLAKTLKALINGKENNSQSDASLVFQARYALLALRRLRSPKTWWRSLWAVTQDFRRGVAYLGWIWFSKEADKFLKALSKISAGFKKIKEEWLYYYKERKWYAALCAIDKQIEANNLNEVERLVKAWPSSRKDCLLQGLCFRLERIAVSSADTKTKEWALSLLKNLEQGGADWGNVKDLSQVKSCASAAIKRIYYFQHPLNTEQIEGDDNAPPAWHPFWQSQPQSKLLQAVQKDIQQQNHNQLLPRIENVATENSCKLQEIAAGVDALQQGLLPKAPADWLAHVKEALAEYYAPNLKIQRISGQELDLEYCYINLAIVESKAWQEEEKAKLYAQSSTFYRPSSYEEIKQTNLQQPIPLERLFDKRALRNGQVGIPKRILIQGRAGVGKTTLCKKLVYAYQKELRQDGFYAVLWLPLRQLKTYKAYNLKKLLEEKYFSQHPENECFAAQLSQHADKILFILDGLDEVATELGQATPLADFLVHLLKQPQVIVTSRPSGVDSSRLQEFDLELETIGFSQENVQAYLKQVEPEAATDIQALINQIPVIQELVNIPVQLDALCYSWDEIKARLEKQKKAAATETFAVTMTMLYQAKVDKLLRKDAGRLGKTQDGKTLSFAVLNQISAEEIDDLMVNEINYLSYLSFRGLQDNLIEFDLDYLNETKNKLNWLSRQKLSPFLHGELKQASFLHTADATLAEHKRAYYFLHLTFQEFFAAKFLAKHLQVYLTREGEYEAQSEIAEKEWVLTLEELQFFVDQNKYNPRYQIVWWMVVGLLEGEAVEGFFNLLEKEPRDLVGGAHLYLIMHCLHEARARLPQPVIRHLEEKLEEGLRLEVSLRRDDKQYLLGSQMAFPENLLLQFGKQHRQQIFKALGKRPTLSARALDTLIQALRYEDFDTKVEAARALGNHRTNSDRIVKTLIDILGEAQDFDTLGETQDWRFPQEVAIALSSHAARSKQAMETLVRRLDSTSSNTKNMALALGGLESHIVTSAQIREIFIKRSKDENTQVRMMALNELAFAGAASLEQVREAFIARLEDENPYIVMVAVDALAPYLGSSSRIREMFVRSLCKSTGSTFIALSLIQFYLSDPTNFDHQKSDLLDICIKELDVEESIFTIRRIDILAPYVASSDKAREAIIRKLENKQSEVSARAVRVLGPCMPSSKTVWEALIQKAEDESRIVRIEVAEALSRHAINLQDISNVISNLLNARHVDVAYRVLNNHPELAYPILLTLSFDQLQKFYRGFLLPHSYEAHIPLYYQNGALHFYTATGSGKPIPISNEQYKKIVQAFEQTRKNILAEFLSEEVALKQNQAK